MVEMPTPFIIVYIYSLVFLVPLHKNYDIYSHHDIVENNYQTNLVLILGTVSMRCFHIET